MSAWHRFTFCFNGSIAIGCFVMGGHMIVFGVANLALALWALSAALRARDAL